MRHTIRRSPRVMLALPLLVAVVAGAEGPGSPSIRALMHRQYTVSRAPFKIIRTQMDAQDPDWEKVQQAGEKFVALAETLAKRTPRHGGEESWRHFLDQHMADAKLMADAAKARDPVPLRAAHRRIAESCKSCHDTHRFRPGGGDSPE